MRRRMIVPIVLCLAAPACGFGGESGQRRAVERQVRARLLSDYAGAHCKAQAPYLSNLAGACQWLVGLQAQTEAEKVIGLMEQVDAKHGKLAELRKAAGGIAAPKPLEEGKQKELAARMKSAGQERARGFIDLASTCYRAGLYALAYDLVWEILDADPDSPVARTAIGYVKIGETWHSPHAALQVQKGAQYVPRLGWAPKLAADRAQKGEWFEGNRFMPLAEADSAHASPANPWIIETENFTLKSTATRKQAVAMAERLESIRALCFRQYLEFFMRGSPKRGAQLLFNQAAPQKMVVHYFGGKEQFTAFIQKEMKGASQEVLLRSAGFYAGRTHASYFYHDEQFGEHLVAIMQHEVTHQILGEYARGGSPQIWLTEGVAECLEAAKVDAKGRLSLPRGQTHPSVAFAARLLKTNALPPLPKLLGLEREEFHREPDRSRNYALSGAFCRCVLELDNGVYAADFLEYLYDSYRGDKTGLSEYLGMDMAALEKRFREYLAQNR